MKKLTDIQRTALWASLAVATVGLAALVWWITRRRAERNDQKDKSRARAHQRQVKRADIVAFV